MSQTPSKSPRTSINNYLFECSQMPNNGVAINMTHDKSMILKEIEEQMILKETSEKASEECTFLKGKSEETSKECAFLKGISEETSEECMILKETSEVTCDEYNYSNNGKLRGFHGMIFETSQCLESHLELYAKQHSFVLSRSFTYKDSTFLYYYIYKNF